jgi:hypothetical protein
MEMQQIIEWLLAGQAEMVARHEEKMDANQAKAAKEEELLARMREDIKSGQEEMRSIVDEWMTDIKDVRKEMIACEEETEADTEKTEPHSEMMQSTVEHQEIPLGESIVRPVRGLRKQRRVWKLAAEHHQKPKERTQGFCGSWKRVTVAGRRTS